MKPTMGSLFTGIGGFDLGFERAGFRNRFQVERDEWCRRVLAKRFPETERHTDVKDCGAHNLPTVDVLVGGDPCQRNSNASRNGGGEESPAADFLRIIAEMRPGVVLRENPSVLRKDAPWPWYRFRDELESLGYAVLPFKVRACCVGGDHRRERLFLLATFPDSDSPRLEGHERQELAREIERRYHANAARPDRGHPSPRVCRGVDGIAHRMDRLRALGNMVHVDVAEMIARLIGDALLGDGKISGGEQ